MSAAALESVGASGQRGIGVLDLAFATAAAGMLAVYSQAWVFPIFGDQIDGATSGLMRMMFFPAYGIGVLLLIRAPRAALAAVARQPFLIVLMLIVAASYAWSMAPDQTARRAFALYCTTLCGLALAVQWRWARLAEVAAACFAALAVLSLLAIFLTPSIGVMNDLFPGAWRGLWQEKNTLGGNMALGFVIICAAIALNPRRAKIWIGFAALSLLLVLASTSKTALLSAVLGAGGLGFVALARRGPAAAVVITWFAVVAVALFGFAIVFASDVLLELLGKDATFTGRTYIWEAAGRLIAERPWTGYGYGAIWTDTGTWSPLVKIIKGAGFRPQHAHNSWLEQWLNLGLIGLVAFSLMFAQTMINAGIAAFRERGAYLAVPFLLVYALITVSESVAVIYNDLRWTLFVTIAVKLVWPDPPEETVSLSPSAA